MNETPESKYRRIKLYHDTARDAFHAAQEELREARKRAVADHNARISERARIVLTDFGLDGYVYDPAQRALIAPDRMCVVSTCGDLWSFGENTPSRIVRAFVAIQDVHGEDFQP